MITIIKLRQCAGYSGYDHLLDDAPLQDLIGTGYRCMRDLRRVVNNLQAETQDRRCARPPVEVTVRLGTGDVAEIEA